MHIPAHDQDCAKKWFVVKILASFLFTLLIFLQLQLWFGSHGMFQLWSLRNNIAQEKSSNDYLMQRNEQLHAQVRELKKGEEALEERARNQLGFIKDGETFYRVISSNKEQEDE